MAPSPAGPDRTFPPTDPDVMYDIAKDRFDRQLGAVDAMDAKLAAFFGIGSAILGITAAIYAIRPDAFRAGGWIVVGLALIAYGVLTIVSLHGIKPRNWDIGPDMEDIFHDHVNFGKADVKWRVAFTMLRLHDRNQATYADKAWVATWCPILLVVMAALLVAASVQVAVLG